MTGQSRIRGSGAFDGDRIVGKVIVVRVVVDAKVPELMAASFGEKVILVFIGIGNKYIC